MRDDAILASATLQPKVRGRALLLTQFNAINTQTTIELLETFIPTNSVQSFPSPHVHDDMWLIHIPAIATKPVTVIDRTNMNITVHVDNFYHSIHSWIVGTSNDVTEYGHRIYGIWYTEYDVQKHHLKFPESYTPTTNDLKMMDIANHSFGYIKKYEDNISSRVGDCGIHIVCSSNKMIRF